MVPEIASYRTSVFVFPSVLLSAIVMSIELYSYVYSYRSKYIFQAKHNEFFWYVVVTDGCYFLLIRLKKLKQSYLMSYTGGLRSCGP